MPQIQRKSLVDISAYIIYKYVNDVLMIKYR